MKILHVVPSYIPAYRYGGPIYSVHGLCKALVARGHDVHVFTTNVDGTRDSDVPLEQPVGLDGVKVWYFPSRHLRRLYYSSSLLKILNLSLNTFNIVHLHSIFLWPTWAAARVARKCGTPYLISPRGMLVQDLIRRKNKVAKAAWIHFVEKKNIRDAAAIHVTSQTEADELGRFGFSIKKLVNISNGVDVPNNGLADDISSSARRLIERKPYLLFVGRIHWKKGLDRLIPALSHIPKVHLIIAGNDEENYLPVLEKLATELGVRSRITFSGPVYGTDKTCLLKHASVSVLPSYSENFGNTALEAMAAGCPVVVTPEVGASEVVKEAGAGIVLNGNPEELGEGLKLMLSDEESLKRMGEQGQRFVSDKFTWQVVANKMEVLYRNIIEEKATSDTNA